MIEIYKRKADESVLSILRVIMVVGIHLWPTHPLTRGASHHLLQSPLQHNNKQRM